MKNYKSLLLLISTIGTSYFFYKLFNIYKKNNKKREHVIKLLEEIKSSTNKSVFFPKLIIPSSEENNLKKIFKFPNKKNNPVILTPDFGNSRLFFKWKSEDKKYLYKPIEKDWEKLWLNIEALSPNISNADDWREKIKVNYDSKSDEKFLNNKNINVTPWRKSNYTKKGNFKCTKDFGYVECVDKLLTLSGSQTYEAQIFHTLINFLKEKGYSNGLNMFGTSYDFRRITSPIHMDIYFKMFKDLIEYSYEKNKKSAVIISHGLGCNLTLLFFNYYLSKNLEEKESQKWKNKHIKLWIPINGAFGGIPQSVRLSMSGGNEGLGIKCFTYGCNEWYWNIEKMMSGLLWSFPDSNIFQGLNVIKHNNKNYRVNDYVEFLKLCGNNDAIKAINETILPIKKFSLLQPRVKTHVILGKSYKTEIMYNYIKENDEKFFQRKYKPLKIYEQLFYKNLKMNEIQKILLKNTKNNERIGNGTAPFLSLRTPLLWKKDSMYPNLDKNTKKYLPVSITTLVGKKMTHQNILNQNLFLNKINNILEL